MDNSIVDLPIKVTYAEMHCKTIVLDIINKHSIECLCKMFIKITFKTFKYIKVI